ncbi:hypothetical protein HTZ77_13850 [Nonomuraea sp. SMC257]|uniref:Uncharacterized protein n=1 Tax=Nonomuraea montanisoli TaxID=2741721 RepID=A0A7Y6M3H8_9ACTN|nr:hypothetical protein [Nonomuraea montanisoli]NUW32506.1 hypothetical protein [Nonomuraea montanisoli]
MIRRILAGAAIAGIAFGFSATAASADDYNSGNSVLSQFSALDNATVLNGVLNDSVKDIDVLNVAKLEDVNVAVLNNG